MFQMPTPASPVQAALQQLKQKRDLSMSNPAGTNEGGTEFYVNKDMAPDGIAQGDEVCVYGTVTKIGSQISISPSRVEKAAEEDAQPPDLAGAEQ